MNSHARNRMRVIVVAFGLASVTLAHADSDRLLPRDVPVAYTQECGACHTPYAPGMLPARSWHRLMHGLDKHYGTDATLDATTTRQLLCLS